MYGRKNAFFKFLYNNVSDKIQHFVVDYSCKFSTWT